MLHPDTELRRIDGRVGYGVFATAPIPTGTITWVLDRLDRVLPPDEVRRLDRRHLEVLERYSWLTASGDRILCWDFGRFMNHSCAPTCVGVGPHVEVAVRDIAAGSQLTNDYATLNLERPFRCRCGQSRCRGTVRADDLDERAPVLDRWVTAAVRTIPAVPQPLLPWLQDRARFDAVVDGRRPVPSVRALRADPWPSVAPVGSRAG